MNPSIRSTLVASLLLIGSACAASGVARADAKGAGSPGLAFNRDNAVHGIKDRQLYAYVDLAGSLPELQPLRADALTKLVLDASVKSAAEWWKAPRFAGLETGVIDVITILNKDEYAKADFSSALMHGKVFLRKGKAGVTVERHTLNFDNLRSIKAK